GERGLTAGARRDLLGGDVDLDEAGCAGGRAFGGVPIALSGIALHDRGDRADQRLAAVEVGAQHGHRPRQHHQPGQPHARGGQPGPFRGCHARLLNSATRWRGLVDGVAASLHARGDRTVVVGLLPGLLLLLRRDLRLVVAVLLIAPHGPEDRAGRGADRRALAGIAADRAADGANRRAARCALHRLATRGWRWWRGRGRSRAARLLHGPPVAFGRILLLLLRTLPALRI